MCNIYCVSETTPFIWPAAKRFDLLVMVKNLFWENFVPIFKRALIIGWIEWLPSLHGSCPIWSRKKKKETVLCVHLLVSSAQAVTTVSHSMLLFSYFGTLLTLVCPVCESSSSQLSWLNCLFDLTSSERSLSAGGVFCDHLTSLINKS